MYRKNHIKIYQTIYSFYSKKDLNLLKKGIISSEKMRNSGNMCNVYDLNIIYIESINRWCNIVKYWIFFLIQTRYSLIDFNVIFSIKFSFKKFNAYETTSASQRWKKYTIRFKFFKEFKLAEEALMLIKGPHHLRLEKNIICNCCFVRK